MEFESVVTSSSELRALYRRPGKPALAKQLDHLDEHCRALIAHSPFVVIATADAEGGCDASPRGGPAGFVHVLDAQRLCLPDLAGNNRLDSYENLLECPGVGLLFFVPGRDETLRVNGRAQLTTDPALLDACAIDGTRPRLAVGVTVDEAFIHCAKAFRRGALWHPEQWPDVADLPSAACMLRDHAAPGFEVDVVEQALEQDYERTLWHSGGRDPEASQG